MRPRERGAIRRRAREVAVRLPAILIALGLAVAGGCGDGPERGDPSVVIDLEISPTPATVGGSRVRVEVRDSAGAPVEGARVSLRGVAPTGRQAGMEPVSESSPGRYVAPVFPFDTPGEWELRVDAITPDGRHAWIRRTVRVVRGPPDSGSG